MSHFLEVKDLSITFQNHGELKEVVKGINFHIGNQETVAIVGESGSGKSVTALALSRLLPSAPTCQLKGSVFYDGKDLNTLSPREIRAYRGHHFAYVFQEPSTSLHPQISIGEQLREAVKIHQPEVKNYKKAVVEALDEVGIREPDKRYHAYPFELSGGMQQRVMIAMGLACQPRLLIADEPTTALDVTIQKQILELIAELKVTHQMAVLLITHNFGIVDGFADRIVVMHRGKIVEQGESDSILKNPKEDYTKGLISCIPRLGDRKHRLKTLATST